MNGARRRHAVEALVGLCLVLLFVVVLAEAARYPRDSRLFPTVVGAAGLAMAALHVARSLMRYAASGADALVPQRKPEAVAAEEEGAAAGNAAPLWIAFLAAPAYGLTMWLFGFWVATALVAFFGPAVMGYRDLWRRVLLTAATLLAFLVMFPIMLKVPLPTGLVFEHLLYVDDED